MERFARVVGEILGVTVGKREVAVGEIVGVDAFEVFADGFVIDFVLDGGGGAVRTAGLLREATNEASKARMVWRD